MTLLHDGFLSPNFLLFFCVVFCWTLGIHFTDILNIFLIYLISILRKHNRKITHKKLTENPNFDFFGSGCSSEVGCCLDKGL